jgi:DNA helicase-2/ATP-dependent DNA helicase PcrA
LLKDVVGILIMGRVVDLWISTFHSAGVRILRRHIEKLNFGPHFVIYYDGDQMSLFKICLEVLDINPKIFHPRAIQSRIDAAKNELIEAADYPRGEFFEERVAKVYERYTQKLRENNALDFGDLLLLTVKLLQDFPDVLREYTDRFHYLLVDEYQDTNHAQYRMIQLLAKARQNLCVVGDDDQSIYRWRGADIRNILEFENDFPNAKVVKLEQNYRSTSNILQAAGDVVKPIEQRQPKTLWTENQGGEPLTLFTGRTEKDEAGFVVDQIQESGKEGMGLNQMAIFYRTNAQSRVFEDELRRRNIPYVIFGGVRFYDRMEIKDILAYLIVLANPQDSLHLRRIINVPGRGIGKATLDKLEALAAEQKITLREALSRVKEIGVVGKTAQKVLSFVNLLDSLKAQLGKERLSHFVQNLLERTGYLEELRREGTLEAEGRMENLEEFINVVEDFESSTETPTLEGFLDQVTLVTGIDDMEEEGKALPMMTLHLAKGLEFEEVFIVGMRITSYSRSLTPSERIERRLTYVGMTRHLF